MRFCVWCVVPGVHNDTESLCSPGCIASVQGSLLKTGRGESLVTFVRKAVDFCQHGSEGTFVNADKIIHVVL